MWHNVFFPSCISDISINFEGCAGDDDCCSQGRKCNEGEGDCDGDNNCMPGLRCGTENCRIKSGYYWDDEDDCCYRPCMFK